jgi:hypothetical protein
MENLYLLGPRFSKSFPKDWIEWVRRACLASIAQRLFSFFPNRTC